jgi:hypothetical protein
MRAEKAKKYIELKNKPKDPEYEEWFLRYRPTDVKSGDKNQDKNSKDIKTRNNKKKKRKNKTIKRKGIFF